MKKLYTPAWLILAAVLASCAMTPAVREEAERSSSAPERPEKPQVPELIMGKGQVLSKDKAAFLLNVNPGAEKKYVESLAVIYTQEAAAEGVNHDVAFAQMCLETGFLKYGGDVKPEQYNYCGLGATGNGNPGLSFPDSRIGVRAHIQHLKAYATAAPLKQELVDPRYRYVRYGSAPSIKGLSGTWAADRGYAEKISNILSRLYNFTYGS